MVSYILRVDTTDGTAGDRVQLYINGVKETSFGTSVDPSQNYAWIVTGKRNTLFVIL